MRILLISPFYPPEVGSASHLYFELVQELLRRGHRVMVLTGLPRYHVVEKREEYRRRLILRESFQGLRVTRAFNFDIPWNVPLLRGLDQWVTAFSLGLAGCGLPDFDVALVYSPPLPVALSALGLCRLRRRPLIVNIQDLFPQSAIDLGVLTNSSLIAIFKRLESYLYQHADLIMVHSKGNQRYVLEAGGRLGKVFVIPNWIDTNFLKPGMKDNGLRVSLKLQEHFIVSFAGVMGYSQDLETILSSANILRDYKEIAFLLVGDGIEKQRMIHLARRYRLENIHFLPMQPKEKYPDVLSASDVCLVTLRKEVQTPVVPSKILSIMAAGRPLLASLPLEGDAPQLIGEAQCGLAIPPGEPKTMAQAIFQLYKDPILRETMGTHGRRYAVQNFSLESCIGTLEQYLKSLSSDF